MKKDLSVIIPFAGEYPQVLFTVQAMASVLKDKLDFEIIVIDNDCQELRDQWMIARMRAANQLNQLETVTEQDIDKLIPSLSVMSGKDDKGAEKSAKSFFAAAGPGKNEWLTYMKFNEWLSHWECKRIACENAKADTFLFVDAHTIPTNGIPEMFDEYNKGFNEVSSFHMPLTYKIMEWRRMAYKMVIEKNFYGYSLTGFPSEKDHNSVPVEVPVMSTCGMMLSRQVYDRIGGWPKYFRAYGGGENFMNYALAVTGHKKFIYPGVTLFHHGEKRDYHSTYDGTLWNKLVAHYLFGGVEKLENLANSSKGKKEVLKMMVNDIKSISEYLCQRRVIKENTVIHVDDWAEEWSD